MLYLAVSGAHLSGFSSIVITYLNEYGIQNDQLSASVFRIATMKTAEVDVFMVQKLIFYLQIDSQCRDTEAES